MQKTKTIDKIFPKWVYYVVLAIVIFYGNYFYNMSAIYDTASQLNLANAKHIPFLTNVFLAAAQFGLFELLSRLYYNFILKGTNFKGLTCTKTQFVDTLRVFFIFKLIALGTATLVVYFVPYLIPLAVNTFNLLFSIVFYYLFFLYIKNKYVNKEMAGRVLLHFAIPFFVYSALMLIFNLVL